MIYFLMIAALIGVDQWTKYWAVQTLMPLGTKPILPGLIGFRYAENTGAAFSILRDQQIVLILVTFVILAGLFGYLFKGIRTDAIIGVKVAYVLLIAGAIGNFIDRVRFNYVVDFFEFQFMRFAIFNVADVCVVAGAILLGICVVFFKYDF